jgi:hypothetical protein
VRLDTICHDLGTAETKIDRYLATPCPASRDALASGEPAHHRELVHEVRVHGRDQQRGEQRCKPKPSTTSGEDPPAGLRVP